MLCGAGWEFAHVGIYYHSRVAYVEVLADEKRETAAGFLERVARWFAGELGVRTERLLTDNGSGYRSKVFHETREELGARHGFTRLYRPRTNGKSERLIADNVCEWAYGKPFNSLA